MKEIDVHVAYAQEHNHYQAKSLNLNKNKINIKHLYVNYATEFGHSFAVRI